jgi:membrane associated rhomboid family serine protease
MPDGGCRNASLDSRPSHSTFEIPHPYCAMTNEDHIEFMQALWSRRTPFTYIFLVLNISIFIMMEFAGGTTNEATLMAFGVKSNMEIDQGQVWRFVTPIFIHIGILHLFFNSYALWMVGPQVEKLYGSARFVLLYVFTGVAGVAGSYFYHPEVISAGASGAIFGLFGVLAVFGIKYRKTIPPFFKRAVGAGVLPVIVINLIIGFSIPGIDNAAHISGLVAGAALAFLFSFQEPGSRTGPLLVAAQAAVVLAVVASFYAAATGSSTQELIDAVNSAQRSFNESAEQLGAEDLEDLESMKKDAATAIDALQGLSSIDSEPDRLIAELLRLMEEQYRLITDIERSGRMTFAHNLKLKENVRDFNEVERDLSEWVRRDGRRFGIEMGKRP